MIRWIRITCGTLVSCHCNTPLDRLLEARYEAVKERGIMGATQAEGVGVLIECRHLCSMMRGVEKQNSVMTTSSVLGSFHDDEPSRSEFLTLISRVV